MLLHMVFSTRCCGCDPKDPVCSLATDHLVVLRTVCEFVSDLHTVHKTTHRLLRATATKPIAEHHMQ